VTVVSEPILAVIKHIVMTVYTVCFCYC